MVMSDLETYIQAMRKDVTGDVELLPHHDALLDLRLEAAGRDDVTSWSMPPGRPSGEDDGPG